MNIADKVKETPRTILLSFWYEIKRKYEARIEAKRMVLGQDLHPPKIAYQVIREDYIR